MASHGNIKRTPQAARPYGVIDHQDGFIMTPEDRDILLGWPGVSKLSEDRKELALKVLTGMLFNPKNYWVPIGDDLDFEVRLRMVIRALKSQSVPFRHQFKRGGCEFELNTVALQSRKGHNT